TVWEEIIVNAPQDVLLVGLSATVANVKEIAGWISIVHRPIVPIFHPHRPVPLSYAVADLAGEVHEIAEVRAGRARLGRAEALGLGVGLHHAGILPSVKRLIELSFERGLCKVVFATETMSLGIHMPARSVVLQGVTKRTDRGFRALSHNELTQMAGRAGRRGIDPEGTCVIALDARDGVEDLLRVVDG